MTTRSRGLARQEDRPPVLIIGPTGSQLDKIDYRETELARLQEELAELRGLLAPLKTFRELLSLDCPKFLDRKITILECASYRERGQCIRKRCLPRQGLLAKISL